MWRASDLGVGGLRICDLGFWLSRFFALGIGSRRLRPYLKKLKPSDGDPGN